ncbi:MAG: ribosome-associated translation inhibitor RaiA [Candidatus Aminicenantes bacterium]|nr:ribosome-associated translation inhibitor RaiA [Candidatus Aminicenantes bacterium]
MSINFSTKNIKIPGALKAYIEKHLHDIEKIAGAIIDAEVIIHEEKLSFKVEMTLKTRLNSFYAEDRNKLLKQAVRNTLTTLKSQAKKNKEKLKEEKKRASDKGFFKRTLGFMTWEKNEASEGNKTLELAKSSKILISENYSVKPISVEEAVFFLRESGENGYMFVNAETNRLATVFFGENGSISLIEPNL